jgi:hypothetical protein
VIDRIELGRAYTAVTQRSCFTQHNLDAYSTALELSLKK